jgi:hypothetical protein
MINLVKLTAAPDPTLSKLGTALPIIAALALLLLSPLFTEKAKRLLAGQIAMDSVSYRVDTSTDVPPHLTPKVISDYVEYAADMVQIIPLTFLPAFGAIFAIFSNVSHALAIAVLGFAVIVAVAMDTWLITRSAADYVSRKRFGYSVTLASQLSAMQLALPRYYFSVNCTKSYQ